MKVRKISIFTQLFVFLAALLLLGNGALGFFSYNYAKSALFNQIKFNVMNLASCASANVSGADLNAVAMDGEDLTAYSNVLNQLSLFRDNSDLEYIYTLKKTSNDSFIFLVDSDLEEPADIGEECETTEAMLLAYLNKETTADEETVTDEWGTHLSAYSPICFKNEIVGLVGIDVSANWINEQMSSLGRMIISIAIGTYALSLVVLLLLMLKFKRSIVKLNNKVKELASGSCDLTKEIEISSGDEMEVIANNMNSFLQQIQNLISNVSVSTEKVLSTGEEVNMTADNNTKIIINMSSKIEDISASMQESSASSQMMSENLSKSSSDIGAFVENIENITNTIEEANIRATQALASTMKNKEHTLSTIKNLRERISEANEDMQKIEQVKTIAQSVSNIASQTNMLSLNASIEAAKAGEQGKGFAVVAEQVGKLSSDINHAVKEITQINEQILSATQFLMGATGEIVQFVSEDVVKDYETFENVSKEYGATTLEIKKQISGISSESSLISNNIKDINEQVQAINTMVSTTSENAVELASSISEISKSMEALNENAKKNAKYSETLNDQIKKYTF